MEDKLARVQLNVMKKSKFDILQTPDNKYNQIKFDKISPDPFGDLRQCQKLLISYTD